MHDRLSVSALFEEVSQLAGTTRVAQLAQRLRLDLPDALAGHAKIPADLFQRPATAIFQAESKLEDAALALAQRAEYILHLLPKELERRGVSRGWRASVLDEVSQVGVFLLADGRLQ